MANKKLSEESYRRIMWVLSQDWSNIDGMTVTYNNGGCWVKMSF